MSYNQSNTSNLSHYENLCSIAQSTMTSPFIAILLPLEIVLGIFALILNFIFILIIRRVQVFHINLRLLLGHLSLNLLILSSATIIKALIISSTILNGSYCRFITSMYTCRIKESIFQILSVNIVYTLPAILLERLYSTVRHSTYDRSKPWLSVFLILIIWAFTFWYCLAGLLEGSDINSILRQVYIPVCESWMGLDKSLSATIALMQISTETISLSLVVGVYAYNRYKLNNMGLNRAKHTLASRFQIIQNVEINSVMMPTIILHAVCYLANYIFLFLIFAQENMSPNVRTWILHFVYIWRSIYALAFPLLAFKRSPAMRKRLANLKIFKKFFKIQDDTVGAINIHSIDIYGNSFRQANAHFQVLGDLWNRPLPKR